MPLLFFTAAFALAGQSDAPRIHARREWHAEALGDIPGDPVKTRIVLHHSADFITNADKNLTGEASWDSAVAHARKVQFFHKHIRGWKDVGYHYLIDWEGRILEGRPIDLLGSHVEKHNTGAIGIVLMGDFSRQRPTARQIESLRLLLNWLMADYRIPAKEITGHYQMKKTICPGTYLDNVWDADAQPVDYLQVGERPKQGGRRKRPGPPL